MAHTVVQRDTCREGDACTREGGREGGREGVEGGREGGRERERERGREKNLKNTIQLQQLSHEWALFS